MAVLVLDSEAVSSLARPQVDPARHQRVRAAMRSAHSRNAPVRIPAAVLVELYRGRGTDEAIDVVLARGIAQVVTTGARTARIAGHLLGRIGAAHSRPRFVGRPAAASPATGLLSAHKKQQDALVDEALTIEGN